MAVWIGAEAYSGWPAFRYAQYLLDPCKYGANYSACQEAMLNAFLGWGGGKLLGLAFRPLASAGSRWLAGLPIRQHLPRRVPWVYGETQGALGLTDKFGNITIRSGLTGRELEETVRHEAVHRFFSPKAGGAIQEVRANIRMNAYNKSHFLRYIEEALAEGYATRSIASGLGFPFNPNYEISLVRLVVEGGAAAGLFGGGAYGGYALGR